MSHTDQSKPHRRHRMLVVIEGDTWADIVHELDAAWYRAETSPTDAIDVTSGGATSSRIMIATVDPHQTHDTYIQQITAEIEQRRANNPTTQNDGARRSEDTDR